METNRRPSAPSAPTAPRAPRAPLALEATDADRRNAPNRRMHCEATTFAMCEGFADFTPGQRMLDAADFVIWDDGEVIELA